MLVPFTSMAPRTPLRIVTVQRLNHGRRSFWWWSHNANHSAADFEEDSDKHIRRRQRRFRSRHARSIRRKAMWDKEPGDDEIQSLWPWSGPRWAKRLCINSDFVPAKVTLEHHRRGPKAIHRDSRDAKRTSFDDGPCRGPMSFEEEFDAFKRKIDSDPYGAIFGRRLEQGSKYPFLSWFMYAPEEGQILEKSSSRPGPNKDDHPVQPDPSSTSAPKQDVHDSTTNDRPPQKTTVHAAEQANVEAEDYVYDPISMRKVPRQPLPGSATKKAPDNEAQDSPEKQRIAADSSATSKAESPRSTAASPNDFTSDHIAVSPPMNPPYSLKESGDNERDAPLFSGTAYERSPRVKDITRSVLDTPKDTKRSWLSREGFISDDTKTTKPETTEESKTPRRLIPALDRMNAGAHSSEASDLTPGSLRRRKALERNFENQEPEHELLTPSHPLKKSTTLSVDAEVDRTDSEYSQDSTIPSTQKSPAAVESVTTTAEYDLTSSVDPAVSSASAAVSPPRMAVPQQTPLAVSREQQIARERMTQMHQAAAAACEQERAARLRDLKIAIKLKELYEEYYGEISEEHRQTDPANIANTDHDAQTTALEMAQIIASPKEEDRASRFRDMKVANTIKELYEERYGKIDTHHRQPVVAEGGSEAVNELEFQTPDASPEPSDSSELLALQRDDATIRKREEEVAALASAIRKLNEFLGTAERTVRESRLASLPSTTSAQDTALNEVKKTTYKILAFDFETGAINMADMSSSMVNSYQKPIHPAKVLSRLDKAAKFLPYLDDLERQGYEVFSGSGDVLILKRVQENTPATSSEAMEMSMPVDDEVNDSAGKIRLEGANSAKVHAGQRVRRQETVFSGSQHRRPKEPRRQGPFETTRRVLLGGALTAAFCYIVGLVTETLRGDVETPRTVRRPGIYSTEDSR